MEITFKDLHIGDIVKTTDNRTGVIHSISSYPYAFYMKRMRTLDDIAKHNYKFSPIAEVEDGVYPIIIFNLENSTLEAITFNDIQNITPKYKEIPHKDNFIDKIKRWF